MRTDASLQPVPADSALPVLPSDTDAVAPRSGSVFQSLQLEADQWYEISDGVAGGGGNAILQPSGAPAWAMYQLPGVGEDYVPLNIARYIVVPTGSCWFAVANYKSGRWEFSSYSNQLGQSFAYGDNWQDYVSPGGFVYCLVLATAGQCHVDYINFQVDNNLPPEPPANLAATPGELSALLEWDAVTDSRISELRIYHSLDSSMAGSSLLGTVGPGLTEKLYEDLDHTVVHYFTIRSYVVELDLESADSNIASCQPTGPVADTFLPPTGLQAEAAPLAADLSWDTYTDPRASHIRVYYSEDSGMAGAVLAAQLPATDTVHQVTGLLAGGNYYFALTAWWEAAQLESAMGNIASCVPTEEEVGLMEGLWPRFGGGREAQGFSSNVGPDGLRDIESVSLTENRFGKCHVSPVIDSNGRVYGISRDAQLSCYSPDLRNRLWRTDANVALDDMPGAGQLLVNGQAPLLDNKGNIYFVAVEDNGDGSSGPGWLLSFNKDGGYRWRYGINEISHDDRRPCPSVNMHPDGTLVCVGSSNEILFGVSTTGGEVWTNTDGSGTERQYFADIAMDGNGLIGLPVFGSGPAIDPRPHWRSYDGASGIEQQVNLAMGTPDNLYGGVFMPNGYFYFPSNNSLRSVKVSDGTAHDQFEGLVDMTGAPARDDNGEFLFFSEDQGGGFSGFASFHCNSFNDDFPPTQAPVWSMSMDTVSVTCKPAVDASYSIFLTDDTGRIIMIKWDKDMPLGEENPKLTFSKQETSFRFSSFAIGNGAAYVISEDNDLYMVGTPLLPD